jgi:hypothetical protein
MKMKSIFSRIPLIGLLIWSCSCNSKDPRLTTSDYFELGFPAIDSAWGMANYQKCVETLMNIKADNSRSLPTLKDERSAGLFQRIVSTQNIDRLYQEQADGKIRLRDFADVFQEVVLLYVSEKDAQNYYHEELAELFVFQIKQSDRMLTNIKNRSDLDFSDGEGKQLLDRIINGHKAQVIGFMDAEIDDITFNETDLIKLSTAISDSIINAWGFFDDKSKEEIVSKIRETIEKAPSPSLREQYSGLLEKL